MKEPKSLELRESLEWKKSVREAKRKRVVLAPFKGRTLGRRPSGKDEGDFVLQSSFLWGMFEKNVQAWGRAKEEELRRGKVRTCRFELSRR